MRKGKKSSQEIKDIKEKYQKPKLLRYKMKSIILSGSVP